MAVGEIQKSRRTYKLFQTKDLLAVRRRVLGLFIVVNIKIGMAILFSPISTMLTPAAIKVILECSLHS